MVSNVVVGTRDSGQMDTRLQGKHPIANETGEAEEAEETHKMGG
jgi:hypothetical protein